jgi:hypothetical protein
MTNPPPDSAAPEKTSERLPAVWPWLLIPLVALALFFTLSRMRSEQAPAPAAGASPALASPDDGATTNVR